MPRPDYVERSDLFQSARSKGGYIPLTAGDLDNWITGYARSYAASGVRRGQRAVSTYNAGPFVAGALQQSYQSALPMFISIGCAALVAGTVILFANRTSVAASTERLAVSTAG